ncbi:type IV secretory system conjugative DNA transfer family protein [Halomonas elongata]|uniref:type IV secretory system conjugative DNA transfer family protein n=1 Tax=Halomonas elongata TaxID=2746 RepID=UPI00255ADDC7|nr:type IV secretory system conjugative DNA transfer family protein [Halomonas elongata]MDL4860767.1 type IV secretory system conjugative DNA transfer family protein [Halomonas elongata]
MKTTTLVAGLVAGNMLFCASAAQAQSSHSVNLNDLLNPRGMVQEHPDIPDVRQQLIRDTAHTVGYRSGLAARAEALRATIEAEGSVLDRIFDFSPLVSNQGVLPPVIVEAQDVASYSDSQIRVADKVYRIKVPERFVSNPVSWRDYLYAGLPANNDIQLPRKEALPEGEELDIWREAVEEGWKQGAQQADAIMTANFNRLTRDITGMLRYSVLVQKRMITLPVVAESQQTASGDSNELTIGQKNRRLLERSEFVVDPDEWRPAITSSVDVRTEPVQYQNRHQGIDVDETRFEQYPQQGQPEKVEARSSGRVQSSTSQVQLSLYEEIDGVVAPLVVNPVARHAAELVMESPATVEVATNAIESAQVVTTPPTPIPTWTLHEGSFRDQALAWGEQDSTWTVHWLANTDPIVEINGYELTGQLDDVLVQVVQSLAHAGAKIRLERARANHQLIIRNRGSK